MAVIFVHSANVPNDVPAPGRDRTPAAWTAFRWRGTLNAVLMPQASLAVSWTRYVGGAFSSSPTIAHGRLFVASNSGVVAALDLATGALGWSHKFSGPIMTAPLDWRGTVIVGEGDAHLIDWQPGRYMAVGLGQNRLYGLDEATGEVTWSVGLAGSGMPTGIIENGIYYHDDGVGLLYAVDAYDGMYQWRRSLGSADAMSAIVRVSKTTLAVAGTSPNEVVAFSSVNGNVVWRHRFPDDVGGLGDCPLATNGKYLFGDYLVPVRAGQVQVRAGVRAVQHVFALDARDGHLVWDRSTGTGITPPRNESSIPVVDGQSLYVGSAIQPYMLAVDVQSGRTLWHTHTDGVVKGASVIVGGRQYFGDGHGMLWALNASTGKILGHLHIEDVFNVGSPVVFGHTLFIGGTSGAIYARPLSMILSS